MTGIATDNRDNIANANGVTTVFPFTFFAYSSGVVKVYTIDGDDAPVDVTASCTIAVNASYIGGSVTFASAPASGLKVLIRREVPYTQETEFANITRYKEVAIEEALNTIVMQVQQVKEETDRAVKVPSSDADVAGELPSIATRANKAFIFDDDGNPTASTEDFETQAANAAASAAAAAASASSAATQASNSATSASNSASSASAASTSATAAASSAAAASASQSAAASSASAAATSQTAAASSAATATTQASNASTSATAAASSATSAAGSATTATTQATNAASSATSAAASATSAAASYDSFDDRYLGSKTSDPTLDNDGNALLTGALYFNSSVSEMRVWTGSAWNTAYVPSSSYVTTSGTEVITERKRFYKNVESATVPTTLAGSQISVRAASGATGNYSCAIAAGDTNTDAAYANAQVGFYDDGSAARQGIYGATGNNAGQTLAFKVTADQQFAHADGTAAQPSMTFFNDLNTGIYSAGADTLGFATGGTSRMTLKSNGHLLLGTTTDDTGLTVESSVTVRSGNYFMMRPTDNSWDMRINALSGGNRIAFYSGGAPTTPLAVIDTAGNIGTGAATSPTDALHLERSTAVNTLAKLKNSVDTFLAGVLADGRGFVSVQGAHDMVLQTNSTTRITLKSTGSIQTGAASEAAGYTAAGDITLPTGGKISAFNCPKFMINMQVAASPTIRKSMNVASITRTAAGRGVITLTNGTSDTDSIFTGSAADNPSYGPGGRQISAIQLTTTTVQYFCGQTASLNEYDTKYAHLIGFNN